MRWTISVLLTTVAACQAAPDPETETSPSALLGANVVKGDGPTGEYESVVAFLGQWTNPPSCSYSAVYLEGRLFRMRPLFNPPSVRQRRLGLYCRLELVDDYGMGWPSLSSLRQIFQSAFGQSAQVGIDHVGLMQTPSQHGGLVDKNWAMHRQRFLHEAGAFQIGLMPQNASPRIAIIDSAPTESWPGWTQNFPLEAYTDHGLTLARLAEELLCEDGDAAGYCLAEIVSVQAMTTTSRGVQGTLGDLAAAIVDAVATAPDPRALTINLSLGWVNPVMGGAFGGDIWTNASEQPAAAAVHEALQYARCRGAAIFAASGNRYGAYDGLESDPIWPAQWHSTGATYIDCPTEFDISPSRNVPLVTAVGGVHDDGAPLAVRRYDSEPNFVAYAHAAVARTNAYASTPTGLLSGTSVAPLVMAAQTAVLSQAYPSMTAQDVEIATYWAVNDLTEYLGRGAEVGYGGVFRVRIADGLAGAGGPSFPTLPLPAEGFDPVSVIDIGSTGFSWSWCSVAGQWIFGQPTSAAACAQLGWESVDERPYTHPQPIPIGGGCPSCTFELASSMLYIEIPDGARFAPNYLELTDNAGTMTIRLPGPLLADEVYKMHVELPRTLVAWPRGRLIEADTLDTVIASVELHIEK